MCSLTTWTRKAPSTAGATRPVHRGYAESLVFDSSGSARRMAEEAYELALSLVWGARPTFDECLASIRKAQDLL
jgi:hypothetical protein